MGNTYAITGATGNTGSAAAEELINAGHTVRVIGRSKEKLEKFESAEIYEGDILDTEFLTNAFKGADAVYALIPPKIDAEDFREYANEVSDSIIKSVKNSGVKKVAALSSIGADLDEGTGVVLSLHDLEEKFKKLEGVDVLFLRAGYFMENTLVQADMIKSTSTMGFPVKADIKFPMVAAKDIGKTAAEKLKNLDFTGKEVHYVLGQEDVSYNQVAEVFGKEIGKEDLSYIQYPYDEFHRAMVGMGASQSVATGYVGLAQAMNEEKINYERNEKTTTPTSIKDFAKTFAQVYKR